ncbi:MAG TPA: substrate-binding domain-containing protein [Gemmatimonadaceae bacterium]|nr:substrate-binding domain-containing protein [Gemmatimonadaceae bacterium]
MRRPARGALVLMGMAACATTPVAAPSSFRIDGSTGVMPLVATLADEYRRESPGTVITFGTGLGSGARIAAVREGRIDIALASHGIVVADIERQGLRVHKIADVPVVFAVNSSVPVASLTESQVCDIYAGRITNWSQLGGPDLAIAPATRPKGEVDGDVVRDGVACMSSLTPHGSVLTRELPEDMAAFLAQTPGAIGMTTTTVTGQSGGRVRALALGGIEPTAANVVAMRYGLTRESFLVTRADMPTAVARFIGFIRGPAGARVITASGGIPR